MPNQLARELVITVPLPDDKGRRGDARPKVRRFRSHWLELGQRLREFRARYGITQPEIAAAVSAGNASTVAQWESGVNVPEGLRRERLVELLDGRLWPELRAAIIAGDGRPEAWDRGARWYRRASRERPQRETVGILVAAILEDLRTVHAIEALHQRYGAHDGTWVWRMAERHGLREVSGAELRRIEDAAYGLRWIEIREGLECDPRRSLVHQLPLALFHQGQRRTEAHDGGRRGAEPHTTGSLDGCDSGMSS